MQYSESLDSGAPIQDRLAVYGTAVLEAIALTLALLSAVPNESYQSQPVLDSSFAMIDGSWQHELPERLRYGEWSGRDFVFNYGPLYQCLHGLGVLIAPGDPGAAVRWSRLPETVLGMLLLWATVRRTRAPLAWRAGACILWASLYAVPRDLYGAELKPLGALYPIMLCGEALATASALRTVLLWASPAIILFYSVDLCVMTSLALTATAATTFAATWRVRGLPAMRVRRNAFLGAASLTAALGGELAILQHSEGFHRFATDSAEIMVHYAASLTLGTPLAYLSLLAGAGILATSAVGAAIRGFRAALTIDAASAGRWAGMLGTAAFALFWLRYGLSRSDLPHVWSALLPTLFFFGALSPCFLRQENLWPEFRYLSLLLLLAPLVHGSLVRDAWYERSLSLNNCLKSTKPLRIENPPIERAVAAARRQSGRELMVWPWESIIATLADKHNPAYTIQPYIASLALERETIRRLETIPDLSVLLVREQTGLDQVPSYSRTSTLFWHLLERFELSEPPAPDFALLRRAGPDRRWTIDDELAAFQPNALAPTWSLPAGTIRASDWMMLRVRLSRTHSFGVLKPGVVWARLILSNGLATVIPLRIPADGEVQDVLVTALGLTNSQTFSAFSKRREWRSTESIVSLSLSWEPLDVLSVPPAMIALESVRVLRRLDVETLETPLAEAHNRACWNWTYADGPRPADR